MLFQGILLGFLTLIWEFQYSTAITQRTVRVQKGNSVSLECPIDIETCGELHSVNWFKGDVRIANKLGNGTNVISEYRDRVLIQSKNGPTTTLIINSVQVSDEDFYTCDPTFFIPQETCESSGGYRIQLQITVPPNEIIMLDEKGDRIANGSTLGPLHEGYTLTTTCIVKKTRPPAEIVWFRNNNRLTTNTATIKEENEDLYSSTLGLSLELTRHDLQSTLECQVISAAVNYPIRNFVKLDLHVRPTGINLTGIKDHTVEGSDVVLTCKVFGARPPADVVWKNSSIVIEPRKDREIVITNDQIRQKDGTYNLISKLHFTASRFENDKTFRCEGDNSVMRQYREKPHHAFHTLDVMYPPVVRTSPSNMTKNVTESALMQCNYIANPATLLSVKWYRNGEIINVSESRYRGGNPENPTLSIKSIMREDYGNYTCELKNSFGVGISPTHIELNVQYPPIVQVLMDPEKSVKESEEANVTLFCNIVNANPSNLLKVRWYANSTLLKELPDCNETSEDLCHVDPSKLLLESVGRGFFYNYSCQGHNLAGWGPISDDKELLVYYEPGPASISHYPRYGVKKKSVTFSCSVEDPGYPENIEFHWKQGGRPTIKRITNKEYTVEPIGLDSRTSFSCYASNAGGDGQEAIDNLIVHAPPVFIKNLQPYTGVIYSTENASLTCRIECVPRCNITWYKDNVEIDPKTNDRYFIQEDYLPADYSTGDLESIYSELHFNLSAWPNQTLDINTDNANYSCVSTNNTVGDGVKGATYFSVEYPPTNTQILITNYFNVTENEIPGKFVCSTNANPEPSFEWKHNNKTSSLGSVLSFINPITREEAGYYTCYTTNKHGTHTASLYINVEYNPSCNITRTEIDERDTLICTADGNPRQMSFQWLYRSGNESFELDRGKTRGESNYLTLDDSIERTYYCVVHNRVGNGTCNILVQGHLTWWQRWDRTTLIIVIASVAAVLVAVLIICIIIICVCRRRRRQEKLHAKSSTLGDPLTEPGEYENLPFHGLQTAPNKQLSDFEDIYKGSDTYIY